MAQSFADGVNINPVSQQESHVRVPKAMEVKTTAINVESL